MEHAWAAGLRVRSVWDFQLPFVESPYLSSCLGTAWRAIRRSQEHQIGAAGTSEFPGLQVGGAEAPAWPLLLAIYTAAQGGLSLLPGLLFSLSFKIHSVQVVERQLG